MHITASVQNRSGHHGVSLTTNGRTHTVDIPPKESGYGSSVNGGELLFLALATCYCNDIYREAALRGIDVLQVEVDVEGEFGAAGEPARGVTCRARVAANATPEQIRELMEHTDRVAEIQNTLRVSTDVRFVVAEAVTA